MGVMFVSAAMYFFAISSKTGGMSKLNLELTFIGLILAAGIFSSTATILQITAFSRWPTKVPWVILIGSLYPVVVLTYSLVSGQKFTPAQWLGALLAVVSIVLISLPTANKITE